MRKTITYSTFLVSCLIVVLLFVTAKNYTQLALAVVLYPVIAYLILKLFPRQGYKKEHKVTIELPIKAAENIPPEKIIDPAKTSVEITDIDKRAFLKLIGAAGISAFLFSIFGKRTQFPFGGKMIEADSINLKDSTGKIIDPPQSQPLDGFQISEIDDGVIVYYGFINKDGAWVVMREDTDTSSFRYAKGDSDFPGNWSNRVQLPYDYFHNMF